jgi:hypothetical protein
MMAFDLSLLSCYCILIIVALNFLLFGQLQSTSGPLAPSSHRKMRYMPFWDTCNNHSEDKYTVTGSRMIKC